MRDHRLAAAPAAVADEVHALPDVLAELHEAVAVRHVEQFECLRDFGPAREAVPHERARGGVERHADLHRGVAVAAHMGHLVPAVTGPDPMAEAVRMTSLALS